MNDKDEAIPAKEVEAEVEEDEITLRVRGRTVTISDGEDVKQMIKIQLALRVVGIIGLCITIILLLLVLQGDLCEPQMYKLPIDATTTLQP